MCCVCCMQMCLTGSAMDDGWVGERERKTGRNICGNPKTVYTCGGKGLQRRNGWMGWHIYTHIQKEINGPIMQETLYYLAGKDCFLASWPSLSLAFPPFIRSLAKYLQTHTQLWSSWSIHASMLGRRNLLLPYLPWYRKTRGKAVDNYSLTRRKLH